MPSQTITYGLRALGPSVIGKIDNLATVPVINGCTANRFLKKKHPTVYPPKKFSSSSLHDTELSLLYLVHSLLSLVVRKLRRQMFAYNHGAVLLITIEEVGGGTGHVNVLYLSLSK